MSRDLEIRLQSGVLPFRIRKSGKIQVLLVTTGARGRWSIPKGTAEPELTLQQNAAKEAFEEAGIIGTIAPHSAGMYRATKRQGNRDAVVEVWVYLLEVDSIAKDWPEKGRRRSKWLPVQEAAETLCEPFLSKLCLELLERKR